MYSVVLMMALNTGVEMPAHGGRHGCHGCRGGCYGGCCGGGCYGGGCYGGGGYGGGCYGGYGGGCYGGGGYGGGCYGGGAYYGAPAGGVPMIPPPPKKDMPKKDGAPEEAQLPAPARIVVSLPADATLTIDDAATTSTSAQRTFVTPALNAGSEYQYTLKAEVTRNGERLTTTQKVTVRAGQESRVQLEFPAAASVASR